MCTTRLINLNFFDITILISDKEYYYREAAMKTRSYKYQTHKNEYNCNDKQQALHVTWYHNKTELMDEREYKKDLSIYTVYSRI